MPATLGYQPNVNDQAQQGTPGSFGDPNAKISDPNGGQKNFNIEQVFNSFGYYPTQEEINSLSQAFSGTYDPAARGISAVSQYVIAKKAEAERAKNDPLAALQQKMEDSVTLMKNQVQGLFGQLQDTLKSAPKLFGDLMPDQIQEYLAPLKTSFDQQVAAVQGIAASRGLAASSTENNALAQTGQKFQENVLATGLDVGMKSQAAKAAALQAQINNLFGLTSHEEGIIGAAASQRSSQGLGQSNLIASLPSFLNAQSAQYDQIARANRDPSRFMGGLRELTEASQLIATFGSAGGNNIFNAGTRPKQGPDRPADNSSSASSGAGLFSSFMGTGGGSAATGAEAAMLI